MIEWQSGIQTREFLQASGLRYVYDSSKPKGQKVVSIEVNASPTDSARPNDRSVGRVWRGKSVSDTALYSISTNNYVSSHLYDFFGIDEASVHVEDTGILDRDAFIQYIRDKKTISSRIEGRIVDISKQPSR